jgi:hypothetical protein
MSLMIDQIKKLKHAQPFIPFSLELSSGIVLAVPTPDHIIMSEHGARRICVLNDDGTFDILSGLHLTRVHGLA